MQQISTAQKQLIQIALVALLLVGCVAVLLPFTGTLLFACVICVTTAPFHRWILKCCHGRTSLAAVLMSCILLVLLLYFVEFVRYLVLVGLFLFVILVLG